MQIHDIVCSKGEINFCHLYGYTTKGNRVEYKE